MLFKHAKQPRLHVQAGLAYLVEENGALVRQLEKPCLAAALCARKCALDVAEELGFEQVGGYGRAVYGHKGFIPAGAEIVDALREHLLAGAGLAGYEDGGVHNGVLLCDAYGLAESGALGADVFKGVLGHKPLVGQLLTYFSLYFVNVFHLLHDHYNVVFPPLDGQEGGGELTAIQLVKLVVYRLSRRYSLFKLRAHFRQR